MQLLTSLTRSFLPILEGLRALIAHHAGRDRRLAPIVALLWGRLGRTLSRLDTLLARFHAGRLPRRRAPRPGRARREPGPTPGMPPGSQPVKAPTRRAWLIHLIPHTGSYHDHVQALLADPEIAALTAAAPQAGRLLRPLARMFGIPLPDHLKLPPRPRKPREAKPRKLTRKQLWALIPRVVDNNPWRIPSRHRLTPKGLPKFKYADEV